MGAALGLARRGKYSEEAKGAKSKQENSVERQEGEENGQSGEQDWNEMQAKATGKSKQVQSCELRCQEDGKGLCSCCCCSPSEGPSSAAKQELLGLGLHVCPQLDNPGNSPKAPRSHNQNVSDLSPASAACWCWGHSGTAPMPPSPENSHGAGRMQAAAPLVPPCLYHLTPLTFKRWEISCNSAEQPYKAAVMCICKNNLCLLEKNDSAPLPKLVFHLWVYLLFIFCCRLMNNSHQPTYFLKSFRPSFKYSVCN